MSTKVYAVLIACVLCIASHSYGSKSGYTAGHKEGVIAGKEALQGTISALELQAETAVKKLKEDTESRNTRIAELEKTLAEKSASLQVALAKKPAVVEKIVRQYEQTAGPAQTSCALSAKTVEAINQIIDTQEQP